MKELNLFNILLSFLIFSTLHEASAHSHSTLLATPIQKDTKTSLYTITFNLNQRFVVDLSSPLSWKQCRPSQHYPSVPCFSGECFEAKYLPIPSPSCTTTNTATEGPCTCMVTPINPITKSCALSQLTSSNLTIPWNNARNSKSPVTSNNTYLSCASTSILRSLPRQVVGVASLSRAPLSFPSQFSTQFTGVSKKFAICLPSANLATGVVFFGDGPYNILPPTNFDASSFLSYTPFLINPKSADHFIGIKALSISGDSIAMSPFEGVKLSTTVPYTTLRSDIYKIFVKSFTKGMKGIRQVKNVKPFSTCYNASEIGYSRVGLHVSQIDLELDSGKNWTIHGTNSMKQVGGGLACLAFLDGGKTADYKMVIGSFQMEDNFLLFDLDNSRLGFSSSLLFERMTCSNFNLSTNT